MIWDLTYIFSNVYTSIGAGSLYETSEDATMPIGNGMVLRTGISKGVRIIENDGNPSPALVLDCKLFLKLFCFWKNLLECHFETWNLLIHFLNREKKMYIFSQEKSILCSPMVHWLGRRNVQQASSGFATWSYLVGHWKVLSRSSRLSELQTQREFCYWSLYKGSDARHSVFCI